ncbi:MAG: NADH-dependent flavin oxidoreductase [Bacillota bacterium]
MNPFKPTTIGAKTVKNRLVMAPMTTYSGNSDYTPSNEELAYYARRSKTIGTVITAAIAINKAAHAFERQISLENDTFIAPMARLADAIKKEGALAIAQLHHGGRMNDPSLYDDASEILAPSAVKAPRSDKVKPRAMTLDEVQRTIQDFIDAAVRARKAGFDGVEIHGANTYLLQQFFSAHSNRRSDAYGGSLENRLRFIDEVVRGILTIKEENPDFIVGYRLSPEEIEEDGITLEDTDRLVDSLADRPLDYIHLSLRHYAQTSMRDPEETIPVVSRLKARMPAQMPLVASGGLDTREDLLHSGKLGASFFALGTALLADPDAGETLESQGEVVKTFHKVTMPTPLYARLKNNQSVFEGKGFRFSD